MRDTFIKDIDQGLTSTPKRLPSKYFYNKKGDALFVEIMQLPEYYLTRCELDIFQNKTQELITSFGVQQDVYFELIELGAGDGTKTKKLLKSLTDQNFKFDYFPIDISSNALDLLEKDLSDELPSVSVHTQQGDYFEVLASLKKSHKPKIVLFMGSNIGNMTDDLAQQFMSNLSLNLHPGDKLLLGVDLIKAKDIVLPAYNDDKGITAQFNLNLLTRINEELHGDFNLQQFKHIAEYDEKEGIAKSAIMSTTKQTVTIQSIGKTYHFEEGEKIHTEISRKYNDQLIDKITNDTAFQVETKLLDSKEYFADYILSIN